MPALIPGPHQFADLVSVVDRVEARAAAVPHAGLDTGPHQFADLVSVVDRVEARAAVPHAVRQPVAVV